MEEAKVAIVTGSSSGIGQATVKLLSQKGYKVVVVGSKADKVERVAKECADLSPKKFQPLPLVLDFNDPENGKVAVDKTIEFFGRLDVLVNNAGIFMKSLLNDSKEAYDVYRQVMSVNLDATVRATMASVEHLKKTNGNIVFVSSVASTKPSERGFSYCMSKAAMSMFSRCLAIDLAPNVRVNTVSPGPVLTPIFERVGLNKDIVKASMSVTTLQNRVALPEEIAASIMFLISDDAAFITGHELFIDGGYMLKPSSYSASQQVIALAKEGGSK